MVVFFKGSCCVHGHPYYCVTWQTVNTFDIYDSSNLNKENCDCEGDLFGYLVLISIDFDDFTSLFAP